MINKIRNFVFHTMSLLFAITGLAIVVIEGDYLLAGLCYLIALVAMALLTLMWIYEILEEIKKKVTEE